VVKVLNSPQPAPRGVELNKSPLEKTLTDFDIVDIE
jgi:hypothetical protein